MGLAQNDEIPAARAILSGIQSQDATDVLVSSAQGVVAIYAGDYPGAETIFRTTLERDPRQLTALWGLALCLLARQRVFEATTFLDRAAIVAPTDPRVKALQAYAYLQLGRLTDAASVGKMALDGGEKSPFLMATLAQIYRQMGYAHKALEFGSFAAKSFYGMNFLAKDHQVCLPLTMVIADTPKALSQQPAESATGSAHPQRTHLELELPKPNPPTAKPAFRIVTPRPNSAVRGMQQIRVIYTGTREIKFTVFLVDQIMRGMSSDLPYQFDWDADAAEPGAHQLWVRAYDVHGAFLRKTPSR